MRILKNCVFVPKERSNRTNFRVSFALGGVCVGSTCAEALLGTLGGLLGLGVLLSLGFSGFSGRGAFCFVGNGSVLLGILAGVREWHLGRVLTIVRARVARIQQFQLCATYSNKSFTHNMLHYQTAQKSIPLHD